MAASRMRIVPQLTDNQTHTGPRVFGAWASGRVANAASMIERPLRPIELLPVVMLALGVIASLAYASLKPRQMVGETVGVVTIGGSSDAAIAAVVAAGGEVLRDGNFDNGVIARAPDAGFVGRLYAAGVHLVYRVDRNINCAGVIEAGTRTTQSATVPDTPHLRAAVVAAGDS